MVKWQIRCDPDVPGTFRVFRPGADEPLPGHCWSIRAAYDRIERRIRRDQHLAEMRPVQQHWLSDGFPAKLVGPGHGYASGGLIRRLGYLAVESDAENYPIQEPCS